MAWGPGKGSEVPSLASVPHGVALGVLLFVCVCSVVSNFLQLRGL